MNKHDLNRFADVSIRGRVAFSLCCLNSLLFKNQLDNKDWKLLSDKLWSYTSIKYIDEWHLEIAEFIPSVIMDYEQYVAEDFKYVSNEVFDQLQKFYGEVNEDVKKVIDLIFYVGTIELYGEVQKKGKSFEYFEEIFEIMLRSKVDHPDISHFIKYEFNQQDGWGDVINRADVLCRSL